jgi:hypothetical protein
VFPSYREQAAALCRGIRPSELLTGAVHAAAACHRLRARGCSRP